jgi:glycyl-tRNA synthetase
LARCYLSLPPTVAPIKVSVLPITSGADEGIEKIISKVSEALGDAGISYKVDDSGQAIGRRYARTDEIGIPFGLTVDFKSPKDNTVTLRERDSMEQIRLSFDDAVHVVHDLTVGRTTWAKCAQIYPRFDASA